MRNTVAGPMLCTGACHWPVRPRQVLGGRGAAHVGRTQGRVWGSLVEVNVVVEIDVWLSELRPGLEPTSNGLGGQTWGVL